MTLTDFIVHALDHGKVLGKSKIIIFRYTHKIFLHNTNQYTENKLMEQAQDMNKPWSTMRVYSSGSGSRSFPYQRLGGSSDRSDGLQV